MQEAIAILEALRTKVKKETWVDRKAQDCTLGGIHMCISKLKTAQAGRNESS
jgi:hypothetical protein